MIRIITLILMLSINSVFGNDDNLFPNNTYTFKEEAILIFNEKYNVSLLHNGGEVKSEDFIKMCENKEYDLSTEEGLENCKNLAKDLITINEEIINKPISNEVQNDFVSSLSNQETQISQKAQSNKNKLKTIKVTISEDASVSDLKTSIVKVLKLQKLNVQEENIKISGDNKSFKNNQKINITVNNKPMIVIINIAKVKKIDVFKSIETQKELYPMLIHDYLKYVEGISNFSNIHCETDAECNKLGQDLPKCQDLKNNIDYVFEFDDICDNTLLVENKIKNLVQSLIIIYHDKYGVDKISNIISYSNDKCIQISQGYFNENSKTKLPFNYTKYNLEIESTAPADNNKIKVCFKLKGDNK